MVAISPKSIRSSPDTDETRAKLIEAASEVFADQGFHAATIRQICARANVNLALVNYHFGDKLALYTEVFRSALKDPEQMKEMQELMAQQDPPDILLRKLIRRMLQAMIRRRQQGSIRMRLMLHELARPTPAIARVVDETIKPLHDSLRDLLAQILGLSPDHDKTRLCAQSIIGQIIHYVHHSPVICRLWPELTMTPEQQDLVADHIADFSLSYLRSFHVEHGGNTVE